MKRSRKSNRVTWAPGVNLCQVKLFLTEDCPSKVGTQSQDHLQKKTSGILRNSNSNEFSDLPPGFEGSHSWKHLKQEPSLIPRIKWECPPKLSMRCNWHVAAGEESQEAEAQKLREMKVLEAFFLRPSAIPHSPSISLAVEEEYYDDSHTPIIPLTPIEEEGAVDVPSDLNTSVQPPVLPQDLLLSGNLNPTEHNNLALEPPACEKPTVGIAPDMDADVVTAASAAATALMKSLEKGSLIDTNLLVKILSDPNMIEKLINNCQAPSNMTSATRITSKPATRTTPPSCPTPAKGNLHNVLGGGLQPTSKPPPSCLNSNSPVVPMPSNGSLHPTLGEILPMLTGMPAQPDTDPTSITKQVAPIYIPRAESISESAPTLKVGNLYSTTNQVQSTVSTMKQNPVPNVVLPPLSMMNMQPNGAPQTNVAAVKTNPVKDFNYIKNLIREHGSEKKEMHDRNMSHDGPHTEHFQNLEFAQNMKQRETKPKFQKPCIFYRSSRGCRNGSNCPYQHDLTCQFQTGGTMEAPVAKRMKLGAEVSGRTVHLDLA
ncbi:zinc finger CCCH domain-containing protein 6 isoform X2 [Manihot esculenta]|uniref:C3H1-type domain-containing protein n=1 Tax=Manihot esculenta TaxID=3983 RepID=A0A2C9WCN0_MANES|nr:zinc finger CCCH domain-containing protein 6 isoform X2 [Manihot esculenta]OAY57518.1 hypothetical protein MANES_02G102900v8 [Manihot esculenta]